MRILVGRYCCNLGKIVGGLDQERDKEGKEEGVYLQYVSEVELLMFVDSFLWRRIEEGLRGVKVWSLSNRWTVLLFIEMKEFKVRGQRFRLKYLLT